MSAVPAMNLDGEQDATAWLSMLPPAPFGGDDSALRDWLAGKPWHDGAFGVDPGWKPDIQEMLMIRAEIEADRATALAGTAGYGFSVYDQNAAAKAEEAFKFLDRACEQAGVIVNSEANQIDDEQVADLRRLQENAWEAEKLLKAAGPAVITSVAEAFEAVFGRSTGAIDPLLAVGKAVRQVCALDPESTIDPKLVPLTQAVLAGFTGRSSSAVNQPHPADAVARFKSAATSLGMDYSPFTFAAPLRRALEQAISLSDLYALDLAGEKGDEPERLPDLRGMPHPECRISTDGLLVRAAVLSRIHLPATAMMEALIEMRLAQAWRFTDQFGPVKPDFCDRFIEAPGTAIRDLLEDSQTEKKMQTEAFEPA
jgi:hypothetical protein